MMLLTKPLQFASNKEIFKDRKNLIMPFLLKLFLYGCVLQRHLVLLCVRFVTYNLSTCKISSVDKRIRIQAIDGGVAMNNPTAAAVTHVLNNKQKFPFCHKVEDLLVVSLGNGVSNTSGVLNFVKIAGEAASDMVDEFVSMAFGKSMGSNCLRFQANGNNVLVPRTRVFISLSAPFMLVACGGYPPKQTAPMSNFNTGWDHELGLMHTTPSQYATTLVHAQPDDHSFDAYGYPGGQMTPGECNQGGQSGGYGLYSSQPGYGNICLKVQLFEAECGLLTQYAMKCMQAFVDTYATIGYRSTQ